MPYFTFKDGSYKTGNPDSLDYRLMNYINRKADKIIKATDLKTAINALISNYLKQHPDDSSKYRIIYKVIEHNFKIVATASDPSIKMPRQFYQLGQMALNLESIIKKILNEDADSLDYNGNHLSYSNLDAFPFIADKHSDSIILSLTKKMETHYSMLYDYVENRPFANSNTIHIFDGSTFLDQLIDLYKFARDADTPDVYEAIYTEFISGRIWKKSKLISFWNKPGEILPRIDFIMKVIPGITDDWIIDFSNTTKNRYQVTIKEFIKYGAEKLSLKSKEEIEIARHQHLIPQLKQLSPAKNVFKDTPQKAGFKNDVEFYNANIVGDSVNN